MKNETRYEAYANPAAKPDDEPKQKDRILEKSKASPSVANNVAIQNQFAVVKKTSKQG